ncbi:hypothetical protein QBC41DRAFT_361992 [Cercophora samala]|uniref:Uncharacterized protein n=1 Tax=Cercophora samala TaxID=330535 RepID=A0AA39ZL72_9PEZI|nr:hypothetical protein QBC41DRAFT_361992 [Cercophora samala]
MSFLRRRRLNRKKWENPELSCGEIVVTPRVGLLKKAWGASGPALERFRHQILPDIEDTAKPIIMICCSNAATRSLVEDSIRSSHVPEKYPEFGIGASALPLEQPVPACTLAGGLGEPSSTHPNADREGERSTDPKRNSFVEGRQNMPAITPTQGTRLIGRRINFKHESCDPLPFRCATGGAIIRIDRYHYQIIVSHIQESRQDEHRITSAQELLSQGLDDCTFDGMSDSDDGGEDVMDAETDLDPALARASVTPAVESQPLVESPSINSVGSAVETPTERATRIWPTQTSKTLWQLDPIPSKNEILHSLANTISYFQDAGMRKVMVHDVAEVGKGMHETMTITARHGIGGTLAMRALYQWNRAIGKIQELYPINLGAPIQVGDSGSAVVDPVSGRLYGHIVKGCPGSTIAYIIAATEIFDHLRQEHGADIYLCGSHSTELSANISQIEAESRRLESERWQQYAKLAQTIKVSSSKQRKSPGTGTDDLWSSRFAMERIEVESPMSRRPEGFLGMPGYLQDRLSPLWESEDASSLDNWSDDRPTMTTLSSQQSHSVPTPWSAGSIATTATTVGIGPVSKNREIEISGLSLDNANQNAGFDDQSDRHIRRLSPSTTPTLSGRENNKGEAPRDTMYNEAMQQQKEKPVDDK